MQSLGKSGLLIKNHRVNKSLDPEEFSYLQLRGSFIFMPAHTHHHNPGSSVNFLLVMLPHGPRATLLWDGMAIPPALPHKGQGQVILVSLSSFAFSNHFQQGSVIAGATAWASGGLGSGLIICAEGRVTAVSPSCPWGLPLSSSVKGGIHVDPCDHKFHPLPITSKAVSAEAFLFPSIYRAFSYTDVSS